jgi:hypothetical protein
MRLSKPSAGNEAVSLRLPNANGHDLTLTHLRGRVILAKTCISSRLHFFLIPVHLPNRSIVRSRRFRPSKNPRRREEADKHEANRAGAAESGSPFLLSVFSHNLVIIITILVILLWFLEMPRDSITIAA